jgi:hypothetical protein
MRLLRLLLLPPAPSRALLAGYWKSHWHSYGHSGTAAYSDGKPPPQNPETGSPEAKIPHSGYLSLVVLQIFVISGGWETRQAATSPPRPSSCRLASTPSHRPFSRTHQSCSTHTL